MTIKEMRQAAGLTQQQFAELLGVPKRSIENWESGSRKLPEYWLRLIEYYLRNENGVQNKIITQTQREAELLTNGLLALIDDASQAQSALKGISGNADKAIEGYIDELKSLIAKITSVEKKD